MRLVFAGTPETALPALRALLESSHEVAAVVTRPATFQIEEGHDTGPVYGVLTEPIKPTDTTGDLLGRLADAGASLLLDTMNGIEAGVLEPRPQPTEGVSHAAKLAPDDGHVD